MAKVREIAERTGYGVGSIHNWITRRRVPSWKAAKILAEATVTTPYLWLEGAESDIRDAIGLKMNAKRKSAA